MLAADLFCGAGGTSTGLLQAAAELGQRVELIAINHWQLAIETHTLNHADVTHINSDLERVNPLDVVPSGKLRLLVASPECTHFSRARGGKPMSKQSRASVKYILQWVNQLDVQDVLIENVPDFETWGPLERKTRRPIVNRKGEYFHRFIRKMRELGYIVDWRVLNAADYGDPTTRKRLFIIARKGKQIHWPDATHHKNGGDMFGSSPRWKAAREIIDWSIKGESIFNRKRPLANNTLRRIWAGLMKYGGKAFVIGQQSGAAPRDVSQPIPTVAAAGAISFVEPFLVALEHSNAHGSQVRSTDEPMQTITSRGQFGLVEPFIMPVNHGKDDMRAYSLNNPMPTVTSVDAWGFVEPFIVEYHGGKDSEKRIRSVDEPLPTQTTENRFGLAEPFIVMLNGTKDDHINRSNRGVSQPLPTVTPTLHLGLAEPFLVEYYGTGQSASVDEPIKTLTGRDHFGLVEPLVFEQDGRKYLLDIRFRMLQPHELARAMSFPLDYRFSGNREQVVKQIGNAVPVNLAKQLCKSLLRTGQ